MVDKSERKSKKIKKNQDQRRSHAKVKMLKLNK